MVLLNNRPIPNILTVQALSLSEHHKSDTLEESRSDMTFLAT